MSKKRNSQAAKPVVEVEAVAVEPVVEVEAVAKSFTVRNSTHSPYQVFSTTVVSGGKYAVTQDDEKDQNGNKRLNRAIELGHLVKC